MRQVTKEFLVLIGWCILFFIFLMAYACSGGWEVCGYELDKL